MRDILSLILLIVGFSAAALDERGLSKSFDALAIPYFNTSKTFDMIAKDGVHIRYRYFPASGDMKGTIVVINGRTEFMAKYAELVYDLRDSGYAIFLYDHRGQGESQRLLPEEPLKGYVDKYQDYVDDLTQLMNQIVRPLSGGSIYMLAHSLGGGVATAYLEQNPGVVKAFVASSPMYEPAMPLHIPQEIGLVVMEAAVKIGQGKDYAPGMNADQWNQPFADNVVTHSEPRYDYAHEELRQHPEWIVAGATDQWVAEAIKLGMFDRDHARALKTPTLILRGGEDSVVETGADDVFAKAANAKVLDLPGARHEILMETDSIRNVAIQSALRFFAQ